MDIVEVLQDIKAEINDIDAMTFVGNGSGCASEMRSECLNVINKYIEKEKKGEITMWKDLGVCGTVGDLMDILGDLPRDLSISAAGGDCHVLCNGGYVVFDEKDYSEEWNEE